MAKKEATLILKVKDMASGAMKSVNGMFDKFVITAGDVVNALRSIGRNAIEFAKLGSEARSVRTAFANLAAAQGQDAKAMLSQMKELSQGTVSDLELMKKANNALLLGLPVDRFGDMLKIARSASKATGESMEFMLSSIVTGLGRGSKMILDNLGIVIDTNLAYEKYAATLGKTAAQLDDAEKKQAFINEALEIGTENAEKAGAGNLSLQDSMDQIRATADNLISNLSERLGPTFSMLARVVKDNADRLLEWANTSQATEFIQSLTNGVRSAINGFTNFAQIGGGAIATFFEATKQALSGNFAQAKETVATNLAEMRQMLSESAVQEEEEKAALNEQFALAEEERWIAKQEIKRQRMETEKTEEVDHLKNLQQIFDTSQIEKLKKQAMFEKALKDVKFKAKLEQLNAEIAQEQDTEKRLVLANQKKLMIEEQFNKQRMAQMTTMQIFEEAVNSSRVQQLQSVFSQISSLQSSKNRSLVALGKAAAIANITVSTAQGVAKAWSFGPILGPSLAGLVAAAGTAQAAQVAGVQLAEGGIVRATNGGIQATIGEGGQDEAVIPLDSQEAQSRLGGGNTFVFNGPIMGDASQAREFAIAIDSELLKLRQNNESVAFDRDVV